MNLHVPEQEGQKDTVSRQTEVERLRNKAPHLYLAPTPICTARVRATLLKYICFLLTLNMLVRPNIELQLQP